MKEHSSSLNSCLMNMGEVCKQFQFLKSFDSKLNTLKTKNEVSEIMITVVGEFDSGKSSLCNYLLGKDFLPTDVLPTTSIIWEIRFSYEKEIIEFFSDDRLIETIEDFSVLKNKDLSNAKLIKVYSSSKIIPKNVVIVDTPGLSSNIDAHEQTLLDYAPLSDALILTIDANQGFTKTSLNFLRTVNPLNKRIYLVITKSDTKISRELQDLIEYAKEKLPIKPQKVIATSTQNRSIEDFKLLLFEIFKIKNEIITNNINKELTNISNEIIELLNMQLASADMGTTELDTSIKKLKSEIDQIREKMESEIYLAQEKFSESERSAVKSFENYMQKEVGRLVEIAFNKVEELELVFDDCIKNAIEHATTSYKEHIECILKDMTVALEDISKRVDIGSIPAITITKFIVEGVILVILDFLIPAGAMGKLGKVLEKGPIDALLGRLIMKLSEKWPAAKTFWKTITEPISDIIKGVVKIVAKAFVQTKIESAVSTAKKLFYEELSRVSKDLFKKIEKEIMEKFLEEEKSVMESLDSLKNEKSKKSTEFINYIETLKSTKKTVENVISSLQTK